MESIKISIPKRYFKFDFGEGLECVVQVPTLSQNNKFKKSFTEAEDHEEKSKILDSYLRELGMTNEVADELQDFQLMEVIEHITGQKKS